MTTRYDVVVIGAGPIGTLYASFVKRARPALRVLVLDREAEAGHKIGESTLSGFCKALRTVGIPREAMRSLFYRKNGLGFFHIDETTPDISAASEYVLETFDETYQVERRVLDGLVAANARRLGVELLRGATVLPGASTFSATGNQLVYEQGGARATVACAVVADASGPAGALSRHFDLRRCDASPFQTSAVWTYFDRLRPLQDYPCAARAQFPRDEYTQHLCFPEGWLWHIPLLSWQRSGVPDLEGVLAGRPPAHAPDRIVSVGLTLRSDRDTIGHDPRGTFERYVRRYPAIARLLEGARPLDDYYGRHRTFQSRVAFRSYASRVAGDGWLLVGDAAYFVDPLISPGLTGGTATAFRAAEATLEAIDHGRAGADTFAAYASFVHGLHAALERDNQLVYMSFNHPRSLALVQRFQEGYARRHFQEHAGADYGPADTNVWGILDPGYARVQAAAWEILRAAETRHRGYAGAVAALERELGPHLDDALTPYVTANAAH
jgi:flavin-dependent dehydrogenase